MRGIFKTLILFGAGALVISPGYAYAQEEDIAIYDNQTNDFLLPSYFESEPESPQGDGVSEEVAAIETPQTVPADVDILAEIFGDEPNSPSANSSVPASRTASNTRIFYPTPQSVATSSAQQPLLTPLPPLPPVPETTIEPPRNFHRSSPYATKLLDRETGRGSADIILPKDIRLQFLPNRAHLTQAATKWIAAYGLHVRKDPRLVLVIRVSRQNWAIQQARLSLIMQVLFEQGLPARQMKIFQSDRDPDTLVIGTENNPDHTQTIVPGEEKNVINQQKTLSW